MDWRLRVNDLATDFAYRTSRTNEVDAEETPEAELEGGVGDEARQTGYDLDDGILRCDGDSHRDVLAWAKLIEVIDQHLMYLLSRLAIPHAVPKEHNKYVIGDNPQYLSQ